MKTGRNYLDSIITHVTTPGGAAATTTGTRCCGDPERCPRTSWRGFQVRSSNRFPTPSSLRPQFHWWDVLGSNQ